MSASWLDIGSHDEVVRRKKFAVDAGDGATIVVVAHEGSLYAMDNVCIHKERELAKGVVLRDRLVCPGHQWAFELATGWEAVKERCQPTYDVRVTVEGRVEVDTTSRAVRCTPEQRPTDAPVPDPHGIPAG
jgi:nitrite reductase (NADH) small subunit